jgi:hypothetical protein
MPTMLRGDERSMAGKNLLLVSFHDILGVERGAVPRGEGRGKREECSGRPRSRRRGGIAKVLGRVRRKGGRCAKGQVIVDGEGEDCRQINCCGRGDEERLTSPKSDCGGLSVQVVGKTVRAEARGPGAGVSSAQQQAPQLCSGQQSGQRRLGRPQRPIGPGTGQPVSLLVCTLARDLGHSETTRNFGAPRPVSCERIPCLFLTVWVWVLPWFLFTIQTTTYLMCTSMSSVPMSPYNEK